MKLAPLKWAKFWRKSAADRFDLLLGFEDADCHAYITRYYSNRWHNAAWCWILVAPRASSTQWNGWARSAPEAKRQVEAKLAEVW